MKHLLEVFNLEAGYGKRPVLHGVSLQVAPREIVALIGPNGAGKSTLLKAVFGIVRPSAGVVRFRDTEIQGRGPASNVRDGLSYALQGSRVFTELSVDDNLRVGGHLLPTRAAQDRVEEALALFPELSSLRRRAAASLSTGEKQMLALARALMLRPVLLLVDEPSLGLAPRAAHAALQGITGLRDRLGTAVLLVEQNVHEALAIADRVYVLRLGRVARCGTPDALTPDALREAFLA